MAEGCVSNIVKYLLFLTNILIFILGLAVLGCGVWVLVDKPSFLDLFDQAETILPDELSGKFDLNLYSSAAYIIIIVAAIVVVVSFFGCFGAWKESKCMLGTYFVFILGLFIVMVVGAVLGYTGNFEESMETPLMTALKSYNDSATDSDTEAFAYKKIWNEVQSELQCCGVHNVSDWRNYGHGFTDHNKQPEGCCHWKKEGEEWENIWEDKAKVKECREDSKSMDNSVYKFEGCFTIIKDKVTDNQDIVVGVAIGVVVVMFLNMLFSFAMCTMVN